MMATEKVFIPEFITVRLTPLMLIYPFSMVKFPGSEAYSNL